MHGANVYSVMLGISKYARSNRLLSRARSIEVCTEQPFTQSYSEHREYAWINRFFFFFFFFFFFKYVRPNFGQLSFPFLFSISAARMRISAILWYSKHARDILFQSSTWADGAC